MQPWRFYIVARWILRDSLREKGYSRIQARRAVANLDNEDIDSYIEELSIDTAAIGDGKIIDAILEFFRSPQGQALLAALIKLLLGLFGGANASIMAEIISTVCKAAAVLLFFLFTPMAFAGPNRDPKPIADVVETLPVPKDAEAQPTPWPEVLKGLELLSLTDSDTLVDFGCGADARFLIQGARFYSCKGIGLEIDEARACSADERVKAAGLDEWVRIYHADAVSTDYYTADVGVAYLYPETLKRLRPRIEKLRRFASYMYAVPGLAMRKVGNWYVWNRAAEVAPVVQVQTYQKSTIVNLPPGSYCEICRNPRCRNPMAHRTETVQVPVAKPAVAPPVAEAYSWGSAQSNCASGNCPNGQCNYSQSSGWRPGRILFGR